MTNISSFGSGDLIPQEEKLELKKQAKSLFIGVPKEITFQESRIAIVPDAVQLLVSRGHEVLIETKAGEGANFSDSEFSEAGAKIVYDTKEIYQAKLDSNGFGEIVTEILSVSEEFYAEDYHQQYLAKNPNGYCGHGGCGISFKD